MTKHTLETFKLKPPNVLRPKKPQTLEVIAKTLVSAAKTLGSQFGKRVHVPLRPLLLGTTAALMIGFVLDIGPWTSLTGQLLGRADAQEAPRTSVLTGNTSTPSEADRAALRYFAREGDVDRLEAELRRLRALYPNWQPPRDLLDPQGEDTDLQEIWQLVGNQEYTEARRRIAERRERDPNWNPPERLVALLDLADIRGQLLAASEARNYDEVLRIAGANEAILTCDDVNSIWAVADAFANTGRPQRAFDAYTYVVNTCEDQVLRAATLQKAAEQLDPSLVTQLFALQANDISGDDFGDAQLDIIRDVVARGGAQEGIAVPPGWLETLANSARSGQNLDDALLLGFFLFRQGLPVPAAEWFRFALDNGLGADAAEGYIRALRATGDREDEFLAREVAFQWREQTPELMEAYLDAVATILTANEFGQTSIFDVEQASVDRYVPVVIEQRDANGAQALGWYAFNTCQFIIAEEWFISSANWVPTEAAVYGLALTRLRLGDEAGFDDIVDEWGQLYRSVNALRTGEDLDPADPVTGARDDTTDEVGVDTVVCDPEERRRLRELILEQQESLRFEDQQVTFTQAGSMAAAPIHVRALASRPDDMARPDIPRRSIVIRPDPVERQRGLLVPAQTTTIVPAAPVAPSPSGPPAGQAAGIVVPTPAGPSQTVAPAVSPPSGELGGESTIRQRALRNEPRFRDTRGETAVRRREQTLRGTPSVRPVERRTTVVTGGNRVVPAGGSTVTRRVRSSAATTTTVDDELRAIANRPSRTTRSRRGGSTIGGSAAQRALASRNFGRCIALTDAGLRRGRLSAEDATARGFCLLELDRPFEAAQAFQLARVRARLGTNALGDAVYGATLANIAANLTDEAAIEATRAPLSRARRTELQTGILTQRAIAANRDGRYTEALLYLNQRSKIAPLQKDLMLLQGFAYLNAGDRRSADRLFRAVHQSSPTSESFRALGIGLERRIPAPNRSTIGTGFR
ncbi:MAG: hypothetical protein AAF580_03855 [Pseudomonadota bacterium]